MTKPNNGMLTQIDKTKRYCVELLIAHYTEYQSSLTLIRVVYRTACLYVKVILQNIKNNIE